MESAKLGKPFLIYLQLPDGRSDRFVQTTITNSVFAIEATIYLSHISNGLYSAKYTFPYADEFIVQSKVFLDSSCSKEDKTYTITSEKVVAGSSDAQATDIADKVWGAIVNEQQVSGSFGELMTVMNNTCKGSQAELISPNTGLAKIKETIVNTGLSIQEDIAPIFPEVESLHPELAEIKNNGIDSTLIVTSAISALSVKLDEKTLAVLNSIAINANKIDQVLSQINTIQNNSTIRFVVPEKMLTDEVLVKTYNFYLALTDDAGNAINADETPSVSVRRLDGTSWIENSSMTKEVSKTGIYYYTLSVPANTTKASLYVEAKVTVGGNTKFIPAVSEIVDYDGNMQAIQNSINSVALTVGQSKSLLERSDFGLAAIRGAISLSDTKIDTIKSEMSIVKNDIASIPTDVAPSSSVEQIITEVHKNANIYQINEALGILRDVLKADIYAVPGRINFDGIMKTSDPRLSFLDAPITSRSTITPYEIWQYAQRTLTDVSLPLSDIERIWNFNAASSSTPGSIGKRIFTYLDVAISTRATATQLSSIANGLAQQSTLENVSLLVESLQNSESNSFMVLQNLLNIIKNQTEHLPLNIATEQKLAYVEQNLTSIIKDLALVASEIRVKTNKIPSDPATEISVAKIPLNTLRESDARLSNLDVKISSRATPVDLSNIATKNDVSQSVVAMSNKMDSIFSSTANLISLLPTRDFLESKFKLVDDNEGLRTRSILSAISGIKLPDGISAKDIWEYTQRTLTSYPTIDLSNVATKADVKTYDIAFTMTNNEDTKEQIILAWPVGGIAEFMNISIANSDGDKLITLTSSSSNKDGVFKFLSAMEFTANNVYYINIACEISGKSVNKKFPIYTVAA